MTINPKIQTGPVYHCPKCNAVARRLIPYREIISAGGHLDAWGDHIAYLDLPDACKQALHPARVAVFGTAVLPLIFPCDRTRHHTTTTEECIALLQQAIAQIIRKVGPHKPVHDPAVSIVHRLIAGLIAPQAAITEIRELVHFATPAVLQVPEPVLAFQEAAQ